MFVCPNCRIQLSRNKGEVGVYWACPTCHGRSATVSLLRRITTRETVNAVWQAVRSGAHPQRRECPACSARMSEVPLPNPQPETVNVDVCRTCQFVWFDPSEFEVLPRMAAVAPAREDALPPEARERLAILQLDDIREQVRGSDWGADTPDHWWKHIPALLGMPVEMEGGYLRRLPVVTWMLALGIVAISVLAFFDLEATVASLGLIPAELGRAGGLTLLTSFFVHGGILHLVGNVYFLLAFGDNVEDYLGRWRYLALLLTAALIGDAFHVMADPASTIPCIGASGGISGVIAFYALKYPRARLGILMRFYFYFRWLRMPACAMFFLWVLLQFVGAWMQVSGYSNVSSLAHLGGAAMGFIFWIITRDEG